MDGACWNLYDYNVRLLSPLFPLRVLAALLQIDWYVHMQSENGSICIHNQPKKKSDKSCKKNSHINRFYSFTEENRVFPFFVAVNHLQQSTVYSQCIAHIFS